MRDATFSSTDYDNDEFIDEWMKKFGGMLSEITWHMNSCENRSCSMEKDIQNFIDSFIKAYKNKIIK